MTAYSERFDDYPDLPPAEPPVPAEYHENYPPDSVAIPAGTRICCPTCTAIFVLRAGSAKSCPHCEVSLEARP